MAVGEIVSKILTTSVALRLDKATTWYKWDESPEQKIVKITMKRMLVQLMADDNRSQQPIINHGFVFKSNIKQTSIFKNITVTKSLNVKHLIPLLLSFHTARHFLHLAIHIVHATHLERGFQMTVKRSCAIITIATLCDWLKNLTPAFQPMRSKSKTSRTLLVSFFPCFEKSTGKLGILIFPIRSLLVSLWLVVVVNLVLVIRQ